MIKVMEYDIDPTKMGVRIVFKESIRDDFIIFPRATHRGYMSNFLTFCLRHSDGGDLQSFDMTKEWKHRQVGKGRYEIVFNITRLGDLEKSLKTFEISNIGVCSPPWKKESCKIYPASLLPDSLRKHVVTRPIDYL